MRLATAAQMRKTDELALESYGLVPAVLMEQAGLATARVAAKMLPPKGKVVILAGKGNNGGDGFVAARHLANWGGRVLVVLTERPTAGPALTNYQILQKMELELMVAQPKELRRLAALLSAADLVIDALLGTGISGAPGGIVGELIKLLNLRQGPVLAVDLPSGINASGEVFSPCVEAASTVTFAAPKLAHFLYPARSYVGKVYLTDLGIPHNLIEKLCTGGELLDATILEKLPPRSPTAHKGTAGKVLLVAGSPGMVGAAALAAEGALRAGAGLVTVYTGGAVAGVLASKLTEAMVLGSQKDAGMLSAESLPQILELAQEMDAVAIGPGLGRSEGVRSLVAGLLEACAKPLLLDADALFALSELESLKRTRPFVITPHSGELARLAKVGSREIDNNRLFYAEKVAVERRSIVALKGPGTIIAAPGKISLINSTGNPAMASGGMGDLLTGMILGLSPQLDSLFEATALGVWAHGLAGDLAAEKLHAQRGLVASDLLPFIPGVLAGEGAAAQVIRPLDGLKEGKS